MGFYKLGLYNMTSTVVKHILFSYIVDEGSDYMGYEDTVVFPSCHNITFDPVCRSIPIFNDTQTEMLEMFTVTLTGDLHGNIILDPSVTVVKIKDEHSKLF